MLGGECTLVQTKVHTCLWGGEEEQQHYKAPEVALYTENY
jgi:hypothetical protein